MRHENTLYRFNKVIHNLYVLFRFIINYMLFYLICLNNLEVNQIYIKIGYRLT